MSDTTNTTTETASEQEVVGFRMCAVVNGHTIACTDLVIVWSNLIAYAAMSPLYVIECEDYTLLAYCF